jgi:hypothetical protein
MARLSLKLNGKCKSPENSGARTMMEGTGALMDLKVGGGTSAYKKISLEETLLSLRASTDGLTESEVGSRLGIFGCNVIAVKRKNLFLRFFLHYCRQQLLARTRLRGIGGGCDCRCYGASLCPRLRMVAELSCSSCDALSSRLYRHRPSPFVWKRVVPELICGSMTRACLRSWASACT